MPSFRAPCLDLRIIRSPYPAPPLHPRVGFYRQMWSLTGWLPGENTLFCPSSPSGITGDNCGPDAPDSRELEGAGQATPHQPVPSQSFPDRPATGHQNAFSSCSTVIQTEVLPQASPHGPSPFISLQEVAEQ